VPVIGILIIGGIVGGIVIPNFVGPRRRSQEMAVVQNVRSITMAQDDYHRQFGRFASSLSELARPSDGKVGPSSRLLPAELAAGRKDGYTYTLHGSPTGYTVNANPVKYGIINHRTFFSDENMTVHSHLGREPATAASGAVSTPIDEIRCPKLCGPYYE
jgi:type II secretory pathway pseudopilin PulG